MSDPKPRRESLSKTPSWIMLGFVIGCIVAFTVKQQFFSLPNPPAPVVTTKQVESPEPVRKPEPAHAPLSEMEAIFYQWRGNAVWLHDITEVAFWDRETNKYSEYVEVMRSGDETYFRTIPQLTRPLIDEVPLNAPIRFTEPESVHAERRSRFIIPAR